MKISANSKLVFKYLALPNGIGGRGGAQRFFLLAQDIPHTEQIFALNDEWSTEKKHLIESGENPCGALPVILASENDTTQALPQHIATARLLGAAFDCTSGDLYQNYVQDMVADEYQGFRDKWVHMTFTATDEEKAKYKTEELPAVLTKFNALYQNFKTHETYLSVNPKNSQPLWGDAAMFGLMRDHVLTGHIDAEDFGKYDALKNMYEAFEKIPAVAEWIEKAVAK